MRRLAFRRAVGALALVALVPLSARAQQPAAPPPPAPLPSVALPPELDRVLRDYEKGWRAGDNTGLAQLFTEDGMALQGGNPTARGRAAIAAAYPTRGAPLHLRAVAYATGDTVGYIIGAYGYAGGPQDPNAVIPAGATVPDMGRFVLALRKGRDGRWLIAADMDNQAARPPRVMAQPAEAPPR